MFRSDEEPLDESATWRRLVAETTLEVLGAEGAHLDLADCEQDDGTLAYVGLAANDGRCLVYTSAEPDPSGVDREAGWFLGLVTGEELVPTNLKAPARPAEERQGSWLVDISRNSFDVPYIERCGWFAGQLSRAGSRITIVRCDGETHFSLAPVRREHLLDLLTER